VVDETPVLLSNWPDLRGNSPGAADQEFVLFVLRLHQPHRREARRLIGDRIRGVGFMIRLTVAIAGTRHRHSLQPTADSASLGSFPRTDPQLRRDYRGRRPLLESVRRIPAPDVFGPRRSARRLAHTACTLHTATSPREAFGHHQLRIF
jgi:hypothetical protein